LPANFVDDSPLASDCLSIFSMSSSIKGATHGFLSPLLRNRPGDQLPSVFRND
jgi:hypothetical protein